LKDLTKKIEELKKRRGKSEKKRVTGDAIEPQTYT